MKSSSPCNVLNEQIKYTRQRKERRRWESGGSVHFRYPVPENKTSDDIGVEDLFTSHVSCGVINYTQVPRVLVEVQVPKWSP